MNPTVQYKKLDHHIIHSINRDYQFREKAVEIFEGARDWGWTEEDHQDIDSIVFCIKNDYKIPKEAKTIFADILGTSAKNEIGQFNSFTDNHSILSRVDNARIFSDIYYTYI